MRHTRLTILAVLAVATSLAACASSGAESGSQRPSRQSNVLTQEELLATQHTNVHDALAVLRSNWMAERGPISFQNPEAGQVRVYLDFVDVGGVSYLRQLRVRDVISLQFLNSMEAAQRFGLRTNSGPVILVNTFRETP
jgi:hypothetical protein